MEKIAFQSNLAVIMKKIVWSGLAMQGSDDARRSIGIAIAIFLVCLMALAVYGWLTLRDSAMSSTAVVVLAGGIVFALVLGIGLMGLLFYSNREGYDDQPRPSSK